jgi:adenosylcobinamide kinase/adenosylcobinamide-phosphate guanylyltransferase
VYKKILVIGGCRSGKSRHALDLVQTMGTDKKIFVATCVPQDDEMHLRVANHQKERDHSWKTVEAPLQLPEAILQNTCTGSAVLVDCLTLWINNLMTEKDDIDYIDGKIVELIEAIQSAEGPVVLVSNEVGTGIVPENKLARAYRDLVGSVNQAVARAVDRVEMVVAGIPVIIKDK